MIQMVKYALDFLKIRTNKLELNKKLKIKNYFLKVLKSKIRYTKFTIYVFCYVKQYVIWYFKFLKINNLLLDLDIFLCLLKLLIRRNFSRN